jgi:putative ATP-binding cassette transporter
MQIEMVTRPEEGKVNDTTGGTGRRATKSTRVYEINLKKLLRIVQLNFVGGDRCALLVFWYALAISVVAVYTWASYELISQTARFYEILSPYAYMGTYYNASTANGSAAIHAAYVSTKDEFRDACTTVALLLTFTALLYTFYIYVAFLIAEVNRRHISNRFLDKYMDKNVFYDVASSNRDLDNMHQRLTSDLQTFGWHWANSIWGNIYYTGILPSISLIVAYTILLDKKNGQLGIEIAYVSFVIYIGTLSLISYWMSKAAYRDMIALGNLTASHDHLLQHAEHVAFYKGGPEEARRLKSEFQTTLDTRFTFYSRLAWVYFLINWFYWFNTIVNYALPGMILFYYHNENEIQPGDVYSLLTNTLFNYYLQSTICYLIYCSEAFANAMAAGTRVLEAVEFIEQRHSYACNRDQGSTYIAGDNVECVDVTCVTPDNQVLVEGLSFSCTSTDCLIIQGPSGAGKSSILRTLCGIWSPRKGLIKFPDHATFFLPQRPYLTLGCLREQFTYPNINDRLSDEELYKLLCKVDLEYILNRFDPDSVEDWANTLSGGEQQRIGMARLLHQQPKFAVLDEATSAVDDQLEAKFYHQLRESNIIFISVAHRTSVVKYHDCLLRLDGKGSYSFNRIADSVNADTASPTVRGNAPVTTEPASAPPVVYVAPAPPTHSSVSIHG